jgi:hypothetical protein
MELFSASGVAGSADPWSSPKTAALAYDINGSNPDSNQFGYAYIDYKPAQPLTSGTVLYIRISGIVPPTPSTSYGAYAIMVQTSPPTLTSGAAPVSYYTFFGTTLGTDPYPAGSPDFGGVPNNPAVITLGVGGALNRYLAEPAVVDWVKITLP